MTYDHNQLNAPDSFLALFVEHGRRPARAAPRALVDGRATKLREDLAGHPVLAKGALHHDRGVPQAGDPRPGRGASARPRASKPGLNGDEALWTVRRLAELEGWFDAARRGRSLPYGEP